MAGFFDTVAKALSPYLDAKFDALAEKYLPIVTERLLAAMPTIGAMLVKLAIESAFKQIPGVPNVVLPGVTHLTTEVLDRAVEEDWDLPGGLTDIIGIDLTEMFRNLREKAHGQGN